MFVISASFFLCRLLKFCLSQKVHFYIYLNTQTYILRLFLPEKGTQIYLFSKKQNQPIVGLICIMFAFIDYYICPLMHFMLKGRLNNHD